MFWKQLYSNISISKRIEKYVIIEPTFALEGKLAEVTDFRSLNFDTGTADEVVEILDDKSAFDESEEQLVAPYVYDNRLNYILLNANDRLAPVSKSPVDEYLEPSSKG